MTFAPVAPDATACQARACLAATSFFSGLRTVASVAGALGGGPAKGLLLLDDLAAQARTLVNAVKLPVIANAEGDFNDPANLWRTVQAFEQADVAAIHVEDRSGPGKHTIGKLMRPARVRGRRALRGRRGNVRLAAGLAGHERSLGARRFSVPEAAS